MRVECVIDGCDCNEEITEEKLKGKKNISNFYKCSHFKGSNIFNKYIGVYPICKSCLDKMTINKDNNQINEEKFKKTLQILNRPFYKEIFDKCMKSKNATLGEYLKRINLNYKDKTYEDGDNIIINNINSVDNNDTKDNKLDVIDDEDKNIEKDIHRLLGYDPFDGYDITDKKYLNAELLPYLDEQTLDDQFKVNVIIQIVNTNNQIRKIDSVINQLSSDMQSLIKNSGEIKDLTGIKTQLNQSNDKLSKENSIALKHRADKKTGKSTLGGMMKDLRELGFEQAEQDYYDMQKAFGMKQAADISNKSISDILNFDEKDMDDMFKMQKDLIRSLQDEKQELKEKIRVLTVDNYDLKQKGEEK